MANEVIINEEVSVLTEKTLTKAQEKRKATLVKNYNNAVATLERSAWATAKAIHECCEETEIFENASAVAKALGLNRATVSKLNKAYALRLALTTSEEPIGEDLSASQMQELLPVYSEDNSELVAECIAVEGITSKDTTKSVRAKVKEFLKGDEESASEETESASEETESEETEVEEKNIYSRFYCYNNGVEYANVQDVLISKSQLERILAIINE